MPIVSVPKADGSVRTCGNFKVQFYRLTNTQSKPEDLLTVLAGGQNFVKLNLSQAYQQMLPDPEDRKYTTINTYLGLFEYKMITIWNSISPSSFQNHMEKILQGISKLFAFWMMC